MNNEFIWCDLSAFRPDAATAFYGRVLGWSFDDPATEYRYAFCEEAAVAAIFDMPAFFRKINMPSFWMSYIRVEAVDDVVEKASGMGGKVELEDGFEGGKIALIRDPLGAGFTIYEGDMQTGANGGGRVGLRVGHTLHVSSHQAVAEFYKSLFSWETSSIGENHWAISTSAGHKVADLQESSDAERGGFEYWAIAFAVDDLEKSRRSIEQNGGSVFSETFHDNRKALSAADMDGAAFTIVAI